jgi:glycine cleavage system H protein
MVALLVILTIIVCVSADSVVQWRQARKETARRRIADAVVPAEAIASVSAPADVFLDSGHTWVKVSPSGRADVGVDSFAEMLIGRVDAVVLPDVGKGVRRGDVLFAVRQDNRRAAFASPVDGVVTLVDEDLAWHPEMIHADPYGAGWVCTINPSNLSRDLKELRTANEARTWLRDETEQFREFFAAAPADETEAAHAVRPGAGVLEGVDDRTWAQFNEHFLRPATREAH